MARSRVKFENSPKPESNPKKEIIGCDLSAEKSSLRVRLREQILSSRNHPFCCNISDELLEAHAQLLQQFGGPASLVKAQSLASRTKRPGVENLGCIYIGFKFENRRRTGKLCIKVHVKQKVTNVSQIDSAALIPPVIKIGSKEILTDVEEMGEVYPHQEFQDPENPTLGGSSIGLNLSNGVTGTLGGLVVLEDGQLCILSNNHVLVDVNNDSLINSPVLQPGLVDATDHNPANTIKLGLVHKYVPLKLFNNQPNTPVAQNESKVDAALARTDPSVVSPHYHHFDLNPAILHWEAGMSVKKEGRTTGYTEGQIVGINAFVPIQYKPSWNGGSPIYAYFLNQLVIEGTNNLFSDEGDSGSLIVERTSNRPVALLFGGTGSMSDGRSQTFANPIEDVMAELGIDRFVSPDDF